MLKKDEQEEKEKSVLETIKTNEFLIPINSVHDFIEAIQSFTHGENGYNSSASDNNNDGELNFTIPPLDTGETLFFRGEATLFSSSSPSVFRNKKLFDNEKKVTIEAISGGARELGNENTNFNIISKIQHHKGITRMLDVTTNALTSLFFACGTSNDDGQMGSVQVFIGSSEKHKKRALETYLSKVVFTDENMDLLEQLYSKSKNSNSKEADNFDEWLEKKDSRSNIKMFSSDTAELLSTIPLLTLKEQLGLAKYSIQDIISKKNQLGNTGRPSVNQLLGEVRRKTPAFENRIDPVDLLRPIFVIPSQNDERIVRQDGAFLIVGLGVDRNILQLSLPNTRVNKKYLDSYFETQKEYTEQILRNLRLMGAGEPALSRVEKPIRFYICNEETKKKIQKQLAALGINAAKVYADLDHLSEYLKFKYSD